MKCPLFPKIEIEPQECLDLRCHIDMHKECAFTRMLKTHKFVKNKGWIKKDVDAN